MAGGKTGNTQVHRAAVDLHLNTSVLRAAAFRDVEAGDDLDTADHRGRKASGRRRHLVESTVHPVADTEILFKGLKVDV